MFQQQSTLLAATTLAIILTACGVKDESTTGVTDSSDPARIGLRCSTQTVRPIDRPKVHTWVEWFADGHLDTVMSFSVYGAPYNVIGPSLDTSKPRGGGWSIIITPNPVNDTTVCEGDSLWEDGRIPNWQPFGVDTIWYNYGPQALYALVRPSFQIINKDSLQGMFDTLKLEGPILNEVLRYTSFAGDYPTLVVDSSQTLEITTIMSSDQSLITTRCDFTPCEYLDALDTLGSTHCSHGFGVADSPSEPTLVGPISPILEPGTYPWKIVLRTRLGYADSLVGTTVIPDWRSQCPSGQLP